MHQWITKLVIEGDCLSVIEEILQQELPYLAIGNILMNIIELLSLFPECKIQYVNRMGNNVAHL